VRSEHLRAGAWTAFGMLAVAGLLGGVGTLGFALAQDAPEQDWRPPCSRNLPASLREVDLAIETSPKPGSVYLLGIDRSPSNAAQAQAQLQSAVAFAQTLPTEDSVGILFVSDQSDRSSTPDMPLLRGQPARTVTVTQAACTGDCRPSSLFERQCREALDEALERRRADDQTRLDREAAAFTQHRQERIATWHAEVENYWPAPGTSLLRFWRKVADLPVVRRSPEEVTVILWSDLEEARTRDRQALQRLDANDACPTENPLPGALAGIRVVLVQTIEDDQDTDMWAQRWEHGLRCAGARVERHRYGAAAPLSEILSVK